MEIQKEDLWKIFNSQCSLPDALRILRCDEDDIKKHLDDLEKSDVHDCSNYFSSCMQVKIAAYQGLVILGEIDGTKIIPLGGSEAPREMDMGICGEKQYYFSGGEWKPF